MVKQILNYSKKIVNVGHSYMITLPKEWAKKHLKKGRLVRIYLTENGNLVLKNEN